MKPLIAVIKHVDTGLFHGAIYVNRPTPSGCDRWLLQSTTNEGYQTSKTIALIMNERYPDCVQLEIGDDEPADKSIDDLIKLLESETEITLLKPRDPAECDYIEIKRYPYLHNAPTKTDITVGQLNMLLDKKIVEYTGTSGDDPNLHYQYYYYIVL